MRMIVVPHGMAQRGGGGCMVFHHKGWWMVQRRDEGCMVFHRKGCVPPGKIMSLTARSRASIARAPYRPVARELGRGGAIPSPPPRRAQQSSRSALIEDTCVCGNPASSFDRTFVGSRAGRSTTMAEAPAGFATAPGSSLGDAVPAEGADLRAFDSHPNDTDASLPRYECYMPRRCIIGTGRDVRTALRPRAHRPAATTMDVP